MKMVFRNGHFIMFGRWGAKKKHGSVMSNAIKVKGSVPDALGATKRLLA
jgi:hypothetical protein